MLNVFPDLLLPFLAPTLLRMGAAVAFAAIAFYHWKRADTPTWRTWLFVALHGGVAAGLAFGYYTQVAALAGIALAARHAWCANRAAGLLLALVCLSLFVSGAGAFAFDLPL